MMRELTDVHFPKAARICVVLDNLSTRSAGALHRPTTRAAPVASSQALLVMTGTKTPLGRKSGGANRSGLRQSQP